MKQEQTVLPLKKRMHVLWYSVKLAHRLIPSYFPLMLAQNLLWAARPLVILFFSSRVITELTGGRDIRALALYAALTVGLSCAMTACLAVLDRQRDRLAGWTQIVERISLLLAERFATMDFAYTEDSAVTETLARMDTVLRNHAGGFSMLYYQLGGVVERLLTLCLSLILMIGLPLSVGGWGGAVLLLFAAMTAGTLFSQRLQKNKQAGFIATAARNSVGLNFYFNYITVDKAAKDVRLYGQAGALGELFQTYTHTEDWLALFRMDGHIRGYSAGMLALVSGVFYLLVGGAALGGRLTAGDVVQGVGAATALFGALAALPDILGRLYHNVEHLLPLYDYLEMPDLLQKGTRPVPARAAADYTIEFRNVSFCYPGAEEYALRDLNLTLTPGRRLAVVGRNGSGKTTMIKLLCRLYDPTEGAILLDGVNIKEYDHGQYTALFSAVFQDYALFPLSLGQNVAAAAQYDAARAADCLTRAGFGGRLGTMPQGLDTMLYKSYDESGVQISGGEAQKIALARALYKNAPFVVLDEPTAALDPQAEYEVYTTFNQTIGDKTAIFISHRLSSCRFADEIAVFEDGKMVQHGGHGQLLGDASGQYCALWNAQAQYYTAKEGA